MKTISRHLFLLFGVMVWVSLAFGGEIHDAAFMGDLQKVKALLKDNPELISSKDHLGKTPLHCAAEEGHKNVAELLLAKGADVNAKTDYGLTPLHEAAWHSHKDMAKLLLANKADVNAKAKDGDTPLHYAVVEANKDVAKLLLANKAEYTIFEVAAIGDVERVKALLKANPDLVFSKDEHNRTPLHMAARCGLKDIVELLLANKAEYTIFDVAAIGDVERAKALLKANPDLVFSKDEDGRTPLRTAVAAGHTDMARLLLANKADVNTKAKDGDTPLHDAVSNKVMVELLLANGADANINENGWTPLHVAARCGSKDIVELLLANKADVNVKASQGQTPLFEAANKDVAKSLLAHKAEANAKDNDGDTPLHYAVLRNTHVAALLLANKAEVNAAAKDGSTPLHKAAEHGYKDVAALLLANKAEVNAAAKDGSTPLHNAAEQGYKDMADLLVAHKADVNARAKDGKTPLHKAAEHGYTVVADLLLARTAEYTIFDVAAIGDLKRAEALLKANPDLVFSKDEDGRTPLHMAAVLWGDEGMVELLLANKADVNAKAKDGRTPLRMAVWRFERFSNAGAPAAILKSRKAVVELLRQHGGHE